MCIPVTLVVLIEVVEMILGSNEVECEANTSTVK